MRVAAFLAIASLPLAAIAAPVPWEGWRSPAHFAAVDAGHLVVGLSSACVDGCRYDRSNRGPEPVSANPYPLRWLYRDGDEAVLVDERGAGALTRLWMTTGDGVSRCFDPALRVRVVVDGVTRVDAPLAALFDGSLAPFTPPLVAARSDSSGGHVSRVPIAYTRSLRIGLVGAESGNLACDPSGWGLLWYQAQIVRLSHDADVAAFPAFDESGLRAFLATPVGSDPWHGLLAPQPFALTGVTGPATFTLAERGAGGWLRGLRLDVPPAAWPNLRLRFSFDGEVTIDLAIADFFGVDADAGARGVLSGRDASGTLYAWWPMAYARAAKVELVAEAAGAAFDVAGSIVFDDATAPVAERLHANVSASCAGGDRVVLDARGAGKLVGLSARYTGDAIGGLDVLEGDEQIVIDEAITPTWSGTGVEDFFDGGFYFDHGRFLGALTGAPRVAVSATGTTTAYRVFLGDAPTWTSALRMIQEGAALPATPTTPCTRHVAFSYRRATRTAEVGRFDVVGAGAVAHGYALPSGATCTTLDARFADEPPTPRVAGVCRFATGSSRFRFVVGPGFEGPLRLRRTLDIGLGMPGTSAGAPAAEVRVAGALVGVFAPAAANPLRRWEQQEIVLGAAAGRGVLDFEVTPLADVAAAGHNESAWTLRAVLSDDLFAHGFDGSAAIDRSR